MFIIAEPYARFERSLEQPALERGAAQIEDTCRKILREHLADRYEALEITIIVRVESGSTRAWITVGSIVTALTFYGSIRESVDYLVSDAKYIGDAVLSHVGAALEIDAPPEYQQRRAGVPGRIRNLFRKVEEGEMSADEASSRAVAIVYEHADNRTIATVPQLAAQLAHEFQAAETEEPRPEESRKRLPPPPVVLPSTPSRRRRGVIASRDPETGELVIRRY
jgi:hypothetical protein